MYSARPGMPHSIMKKYEEDWGVQNDLVNTLYRAGVVRKEDFGSGFVLEDYAGTFILNVRKDSMRDTAADGDYTPLRVDSCGNLYIGSDSDDNT